MYLHIGNNNILQTKNIIGIFDLDSIKNSTESRKLLEPLKGQYQNEKTLILTAKGKETKEYFSNISSLTMQKRINKEEYK